MEIERAEIDQASLVEYADLFGTCFPGAVKLRRLDYLRWLYAHNPAGPMRGFNAREAGRLVAHYACIPMWLVLGGERVSALLSLNTATHPDFQGRGLFTRLAEATYDVAAREGVQAVYGVANANSTPGFLRKLGFSQVAQLEARVGLGRLRAGDWRAMDRAQFRIDWNESTLLWRTANPANPVSVHRMDDGSDGFSAASGRLALRAWAQLPQIEGLKIVTVPAPLTGRLWLGLTPAESMSGGGYVSIPEWLRPSPLNLIFRGLQGPLTVSADEVFFGFLDFDAF